MSATTHFSLTPGYRSKCPYCYGTIIVPIGFTLAYVETTRLGPVARIEGRDRNGLVHHSCDVWLFGNPGICFGI